MIIKLLSAPLKAYLKIKGYHVVAVQVRDDGYSILRRDLEEEKFQKEQTEKIKEILKRSRYHD